MICNRKSKLAAALILSLVFMLTACGKQSAQPDKQAEVQQPDPPLARKYQNIVVYGAARFWGGAFAGSSFMNLYLKLTDAATGKVLREKKISSVNNAWAAAWADGSSDRTLPSDMGEIVAGYIGSIMPK